MLSAALFLGEPLQWWKMVAGVLVLGGLALNQFGARLWALGRPNR
jgi:O-acetylserine/cysteine efflux transporter